MAKRRSMSFWLYTGSIGLHVSLAVGAVLLPKPKRVESVAISLFEQKKAETKAPEPPPPPPPKKDPPKREPAKAKAAPAPEPAEAKAPEPAPAPEPAANAMDGFADLGMAMGNGGGGLAIPQPQKVAAAAAPKAAAAPVATTKKVRALAAKAEDTCDEPVVKPKPRSIVKPAYTSDARTASVEGVVRVEITVDEEGRVIQARVLKGLGYGLDEAAVAAARQMTFDPGTRCGKAAVTTLSIGMRFALGS